MNKIIIILLLLICPAMAPAQTVERDTIKVFNEEHPLVYEDAWDLWPYVFLNENGEPDGYNIDMLKMIFKECVTSYVCAQNIVVIKTLPGLAPAACSAIDKMDIELYKIWKTYILLKL